MLRTEGGRSWAATESELSARIQHCVRGEPGPRVLRGRDLERRTAVHTAVECFAPGAELRWAGEW